MILHAINKYKAAEPPPSSKPKHITHLLKEKYTGQHGTTDHRKFIHRRALRENRFDKGDKVIYRRNLYEITDIYGENDFEYINWSGLAPNFIEIMDDLGEVQLVNQGSLKRSRR